MKELTVENDTLFIMVPTMYWSMGRRIKSNNREDEFDIEEDEFSLEDLMEEFNYSMLRVLGHNYIWEEFINDVKINIEMNENIPYDRLTRTETFKWKKNPFGSLRCLCAFTLSGIKKAEEEGHELPIDIHQFKRKLERSNSFMTVHGLTNDVMSDMDIIIIRNFSGTVILNKNNEYYGDEELVTIQASDNKVLCI